MSKLEEKQVVIALSGGVDSAVAACLLQNQNYNLSAVYMRNWDSFLNNDVLGNKNLHQKGCNDSEDLKIVQEICKDLKIPLKIYNFTEKYWNEVFQPAITSLKKGYTPNPDVLCNQKIKFGALIEMIDADFGSDVQIATGHYAKISYSNGQYHLNSASDTHKDQTYFLNQLTQTQLARIIFPLGEIQNKATVRKLACDFGLRNWNRPDSTGICFIGERQFQSFLKNYINVQPGKIIDIITKKVVGIHEGLSFYTIGQRKGLHLSGYKEPYFACGKNTDKNELYVCLKAFKNHYLSKTVTVVQKMHWINSPLQLNDQVYLRYRHTGRMTLATITKICDDEITLTHPEVNITAPGQYVVFYDQSQKICWGGGIYKETLKLEI